MTVFDSSYLSQFKVLSCHSNEITLKGLFFAIEGTKTDGHRYISEVLSKDQSNVAIGSLPSHQIDPPLSVDQTSRYFQVSDVSQTMAELAALYYQSPSQRMLIIGVTGTSGKTTTTYLLRSILRAAGHRVGMIGTIHIEADTVSGETLQQSATHTTPNSLELQKTLSWMKSQGCTAVVMEVSSHALVQKRAFFTAFDAVCFTNLSPEHLDFHPNMEEYYRAKKILFTREFNQSLLLGKNPVAIIQTQNEFGNRLWNELIGDSLNESCYFEALSTQTLHSNSIGIAGSLDRVSIQSSLMSHFNKENISLAVTTAIKLGIPNKVIEQGVAALTGVPGRLERVQLPQTPKSYPTVLVDYAHKPDALHKVLVSLKELKPSKLITVVGCGGDRDKSKRPVMAKIACDYSDLVILTSDNPRSEDPLQILIEMKSGCAMYTHFIIEPDRKKAIQKAIKNANPSDFILIAGKGHENYQIIGTETFPFDDRVIARECLTQDFKI